MGTGTVFVTGDDFFVNTILEIDQSISLFLAKYPDTPLWGHDSVFCQDQADWSV